MDKYVDYPYVYRISEIFEDGKFMTKRLLYCVIKNGECSERICPMFSEIRLLSQEERQGLLAADNPAGCYSHTNGSFCTAMMNKKTYLFHIMSEEYTKKHNIEVKDENIQDL